MTLGEPRIVLGVTGGIACYKACTVARRLSELGVFVDVVMTKGATQFVGPVTFEALTGRPVRTSLWEAGSALSHVSLGVGADLTVLAPATANVIAKAAAGVGDDFLTTMLLANQGPVLVAPAMNDHMFAHPATQANLNTLKDRGWHQVGPDVGPLAEGPSDRPGRMADPDEIVEWALRLLTPKNQFTGRRVVVTAGPTREFLDPVRVVTNRSSGKMGFELAAEAWRRGADVTLISGPSTLITPFGVETVRVDTTDDMLAAVTTHVVDADLLIMAAAPSDFRPSSPSPTKRPRSEGPMVVTLEPTRDILTETATHRKRGMITVGFALETDNGLDNARQKLERKDLDLIVLNMATEKDAGFEVDTNRVTLLTRQNVQELPVLSKREVAAKIFAAIETL